MHLVSQNADDTRAIAARFAQRIRDAMPGRTSALTVALRGELGTGKTTFTQGVARALGIPISPKSPTFMLARQYPVPGTALSLWHLDCYRLAGHQDLAALDMHRVFGDPHHIVFVEWPERVGDGLPRDHREVRFEHLGPDKRGITLPNL